MSKKALRGAGLLRIKLQRAADLKAADRNGKSDPYVKVRAGGQEKKTNIRYATLEPVWNQSIDLYGALPDFLASGLTLTLKDWDRFGSHDALGEVMTPLQFLDETWAAPARDAATPTSTSRRPPLRAPSCPPWRAHSHLGAEPPLATPPPARLSCEARSARLAPSQRASRV